MRVVVVGIVAVAACSPLPPPPMIPTHASTEPEARGTTTAMFVIGIAGEPFAPGWGTALRVERQETDRTTVGLELGGGRGIDGGPSLVALRGYGRFAAKDYVAVTYGLGLSAMSSGFVGYAVHGGGLVAWNNGDAEPLAGAGFYLAGPLRRGEPFGGTSPGTARTPSTKLSVYLDGGLVVPTERAALSFDVGMAIPLFSADAQGIVAASIASTGVLRRK